MRLRFMFDSDQFFLFVDRTNIVSPFTAKRLPAIDRHIDSRSLRRLPRKISQYLFSIEKVELFFRTEKLSQSNTEEEFFVIDETHVAMGVAFSISHRESLIKSQLKVLSDRGKGAERDERR